MKRADKADRIGEILDELYPKPPIPLDHTDPYTLTVAVALSAQTTDKKVNEVTPALFAEGGTPEKMAALPPHAVQLTKRAAYQSYNADMHRALELAATYQGIAQNHPDHQRALEQ